MTLLRKQRDDTVLGGKPTSSIGHVVALIVTFNRKELVCKCLASCLSQTEPPDRVFIFDNGSTDGTKDYLQTQGFLSRPDITYFAVQTNIGPSAAFDRLFHLAWEAGCDWVWVMDDDVVPSPNALQELKAAYIENFTRPDDVGLLASAIVDSQGRANNVPEIDLRKQPGQAPEWGHMLARGLVKIRWSTLVSVLIPRSTFARFGSVNTEFYSAGDDIEFTLRITAARPAYLVGPSIVTHLRKISGVYNLLNETDPDRMRSHFRYHIRNSIYIRRKYYSIIRTLLYIAMLLTQTVQAIRIKEHRWLRVRMFLFGIISGIFFRPNAAPPFSSNP